jgi:hypothetical protein
MRVRDFFEFCLRAAKTFPVARKQAAESPEGWKIAKSGKRQKDNSSRDAYRCQVERRHLCGHARYRKDDARKRKPPSGAVSYWQKANKGGKRAGRWSA